MVHSLFVFFLFIDQVSVYDAEGPPVPIPNTEVKLCHGDNTLRATAREDSSTLTQGTVPQAGTVPTIIFYLP